MDELELLKKDWQKQNESLPKVTHKEIYKMMLKKSSSIVKWIFIISVIEFVLWASIDIVFRVTGNFNETHDSGLELFSIIGMVISYAILIYFMIRFYRNYRNIQTTDSAKVLMKNILDTRKTVRYYVISILCFITITTFAMVAYMLFYTDMYISSAQENDVPVVAMVIGAALIILLFMGVIALFYRLIYGTLTRRLKKNYKELERLEV